MTIFAVMTAGLFPLIHAGRMWFAYFLLPYPNQRFLWPNFRSPLVWDVFAISTYLSISTVFFIVGLVPDVAALGDVSTGWRRRVFAMLSLGWEGSDGQWRHYRRAYGLLAALATPLVLSVHSVVSWDFAMALVPGWHSTLFAPFFVDGAIFSGFAMVLILVLPMRHFFGLHAYIQEKHLDAMGKLILVTASSSSRRARACPISATEPGPRSRRSWGRTRGSPSPSSPTAARTARSSAPRWVSSFAGSWRSVRTTGR